MKEIELKEKCPACNGEAELYGCGVCGGKGFMKILYDDLSNTK